MTPSKIAGGYQFCLDNGSLIEVTDIHWAPSGRLYAEILVTGNGGLLGAAKLDLSSPRDRFTLAQELASHNGKEPSIWSNALLAIWDALKTEHHSHRERIGPVDLSQFPEPGPQRFVWGDRMPEGLATSLYGDSGQGKSTTVNGLALSMAMGYPFLGMAVTEGPVVILDWELTQEITLRRLYQIARGFGLSGLPANRIYYQSLSNALGTHIEDIADWCANINPILIIVDSVGPAAGGDPNDHQKMITLQNQIRRLEQSKLLVDHQSKPAGQGSYSSKREFGTAYKGHLVRSRIQLEMATNAPGKASIVMRFKKNNFTADEKPTAYHIRYQEGAIWFETADVNEAEFQDVETLPTYRKIERFLADNGQSLKEEIMEQLSIDSDKTFSNAISKLRKEGKMSVEAPRDNQRRRWYSLLQ